jgi:OAR domain
MHKKSTEALDKLKVTKTEGDSQDDPGSQSSGSVKNTKFESRQMNCSSPTKSIASSSDSSSLSASPIKPSCDAFNQDLRSNSIATLRAKAIEHSAKVLQDSLQGVGSISGHSNLSSIPIYSLERPTSNPNLSQTPLPYSFLSPATRSIY